VPERLDWVTVAVARGHVTIPWESRDALLEQLRKVPSAGGVVTAFEAVGASRPVTLTDEQEAELHDSVRHWGDEVGVDNLPPGIATLRHRLIDEAATAD
jgi:hypothetical protein